MLAQNGVRLVLSARRVETLHRVRDECLARSAGALTADDVLVLPMDMLETNRHPALLQQVLTHFNGQLDVLVCNAAARSAPSGPRWSWPSIANSSTWTCLPSSI